MDSGHVLEMFALRVNIFDGEAIVDKLPLLGFHKLIKISLCINNKVLRYRSKTLRKSGRLT